MWPVTRRNFALGSLNLGIQLSQLMTRYFLAHLQLLVSFEINHLSLVWLWYNLDHFTLKLVLYVLYMHNIRNVQFDKQKIPFCILDFDIDLIL